MGEDILYAPLAHLPRSILRQRSLQKGKSSSAAVTMVLQVGQRRTMARFALGLIGALWSVLSIISPITSRSEQWEQLTQPSRCAAFPVFAHSSLSEGNI